MTLQIKSEAEYEFALDRINALWGAVPNTPESVELDMISAAVEEYEEKHYPINEPESFAAIEFHLDRLNLSVDQLPLNRAEKQFLRMVLAEKLLAPESFLVKMSNILDVPRAVLGIAASQDYVVGHEGSVALKNIRK
jgi:HTH-type transcriptional regulator/antitoxin HigA